MKERVGPVAGAGVGEERGLQRRNPNGMGRMAVTWPFTFPSKERTRKEERHGEVQRMGRRQAGTQADRGAI